jgi:hypothetical protein
MSAEHLKNIEASVNTSRYVVEKFETLLMMSTDQDRDYMIARAEATKGMPQQIRVPRTRAKRPAQEQQ